MKMLFTLVFAIATVGAFAQDCCDKKKEAATKTYAQSASCGKDAKSASKCGDMKLSAEVEFMQEAEKMAMKAEGKESCCKSTVEKPMAKGDKGCCNEHGQPAKFKVFVAGEGYKFFGCEGSASKGRKELIAKKMKVGTVQPVLASTSSIR